jgi:hypothetical protein
MKDPMLADDAKIHAPEERIGKYRVHPVAAMFPLLTGAALDELRVSIAANGQIYPAVAERDVLLDGRNRALICEQLGIELKVEQYRDTLDPAEFIRLSNIDRRHLSEDQHVQIAERIRRWQIEQENAAKKATGKSADGKAGGRGKRNLTQKSESGFRDRNRRSTAGQLAADAKTSRYKAEQAIAVGKHSPVLADQVVKGEVTLADAHKEVKQTLDPAFANAKLTVDPVPEEVTLAPSDKREFSKVYLREKGKLLDSITAAMYRHKKYRTDLIEAIVRQVEQSAPKEKPTEAEFEATARRVERRLLGLPQ